MNCRDREKAVVEAAKKGAWDEALRDHLVGCKSCTDLALVAGFMQDEGRIARVEAVNALPNPGQIWWKAQIFVRRSAVERATRPIVYFEKMASAFGTLGVLAVALWNWSSIHTWLGPLRTTWSQLSTTGAGPSPFLNPFLYLSAGFAVLVILSGFALYVAWPEQ